MESQSSILEELKEEIFVELEQKFTLENDTKKLKKLQELKNKQLQQQM